MANAVNSLLRSMQKSPHAWTTFDINDILYIRHTIFTQIRKFCTQLPRDSPQYISAHGVNYKITEKQTHISTLTNRNEIFIWND